MKKITMFLILILSFVFAQVTTETYNTEGATSVNTVGTITTGTWNAGSVTVTKTLATADNAINIVTTSASTDGANSVRPIRMVSTMTGAAGVGGRAEFQLTISAALGGWANALKAYTVITDATGSVSGLGSAMVSELLLPGNALSTGSYAVNEMELVTQASGVYTAPTSFTWMQVSGNQSATDTWEDTGYIMSIKGLSEGTGNIFSAGGDVAATLLQGLEHNGLSRPLAGLAQSLQGLDNPLGASYSTSKKGNVIASNDLLSLANLGRMVEEACTKASKY